MDEYFAEFQLSARDIKLRELADRYHAECEAYDRIVCTGPVCYGSIMPTTPHESALVLKNARAILRRIEDDARQEGFSVYELRREIGRAS